MRFGRHTNNLSCEYKMQDKMKEWLTEKELFFIDELFVPEVSRRPDFLVMKKGKGLINIEAKCNDLDTMMRQLRDNATYCDYSFAFFPDYAVTPKWFDEELVKSQFGVIIYNYKLGIITEVFEAHQNKKINKELKQKVLGKMEKERIKRLPPLIPLIQESLF